MDSGVIGRLLALAERFVAAHERIADELEIIRHIAAKNEAEYYDE